MSESAATARWAATRAAERRRAVGLFGVSTAHAVNHMYGALLPLIYPLMQAQFHFSYSTLGVVITIANLVGGLLQAAFGFLNRRISARALLGWENVALGLCVAGMAAVGSVFQFGVVRVAGTVAGSPQHPVGSAYCAEEYPPERRAFALSSHTAGGNLGTLIVPLLGAVCIDAFGWRATLLIFSIPIALVGLLTFFLLRPEAELTVERTAMADAGIAAELRAILTNRTAIFVLIAATVAAGGRGLGVVNTYIPLYLRNSLHFGSLTTGVLFNILLVGSVVGTFAVGPIADRVGRKPTLIVTYCGALIAVVLMILSGNTVLALLPVLLALGVTAYAETSVLQALFADTIGGGSHRIGFGLFFTIAYGVGALWAAVIGAVVDHFGFHAAFLVMGGSYVAAALAIIPTRDVLRRGKARA